MTLSNLISKGGLTKYVTATPATVATQEVTSCESVANVATVAVATSLQATTCKQNLITFVQQCCVGLPVNEQQVIEHLLSVDDEQDIINGDTPMDSLQLHIQLWLDAGMPHYSGKHQSLSHINRGEES
jgi:hypothetical protein